MPMEFDRLQEMLRAEKLRFFVDPANTCVMLPAKGKEGSYQFMIALQIKGRFLQFRSLDLAHCGEDHPNYAAVMKLLAEMNRTVRLIKFGLDPADGEIMVFADMWIEDGTLTQAQLHSIIGNCFMATDHCYPRLMKTIETGVDPGNPTPKEKLQGLLKSLSGADDLPPELQKLLDRLGDKGEKPKPSDEPVGL